MLTIHHLENSRSQRALWMLEELGLDYELVHHARDPETRFAQAALRAAHPLGKAPVLCDDDLVIAESGAILEHLVARYGNGRLVPKPDTPERCRYVYWMHAAEGTVMPLLVMRLVFARVRAGAPFVVRPIARAIAARVDASYIAPNLEAVIDAMEAELGRSSWFAGDEFTAADVQMGYVVEAAAARGAFGARHPQLRGYLDRMRKRPAYRAAIARGGPFEVTAD